MQTRSILGLFFLVIGLQLIFAFPSGCTAQGTCNNIAYAAGGSVHQLNLYLPPQSINYPVPVILWLHPGSWVAGSKDDCWDSTNNTLIWPLNDLVYNKGYALACANYSYSNNGLTPFPTQVYESKAAVRYLRANASKYSLDPNKIGVWGWSAGGHMAAMLGVTSDDGSYNGTLGSYTSTSSAVQATALLVGPTFLLPIALASDGSQDAALYAYLGGDPKSSQYAAAAGIAAATNLYVNGTEGPFLLQYGQQDTLVPSIHGQTLNTALVNKGVNSTFKTYPGGHGDFDYYTDAIAFFQKNLPASPCNNNNVCDSFENPKVCPNECTPTISSGEIYCSKGNYIGKKSVTKLWEASTYKEVQDPRWLCANNTTFYGCASSSVQAEIDWWKTFATLATNNQTVNSLVCNLSTQRWVTQCTSSDYTCGDWNSCTSDNTQNRTCTKNNQNCLSGFSPSTTQSCTYVPTCSYTYSNWSDCNSSGIQTRTESVAPANCSGGTREATTQTCTYNTPTCTSFNYSDWTSCDYNGNQTRTITSTTPSICNGGSPDSLTQSCVRPCVDSDFSTTLVPTSCPINGQQTTHYTKLNTCEGGVTKTDSNISCTYVNPNSCTSLNWTSESSDCNNGVITTTWTKIGDCNGGITHELTETSTCTLGSSDTNTIQDTNNSNFCTENDWNSETDTFCPTNGLKLRIWTKTNIDCNGGVTHPTTEQIVCNTTTPVTTTVNDNNSTFPLENNTNENNSNTDSNKTIKDILCNEKDWKFTLEPEECSAQGKQIRYWIKNNLICNGGVTHPSFEILDCVTDRGVLGNIIYSILNFLGLT